MAVHVPLSLLSRLQSVCDQVEEAATEIPVTFVVIQADFDGQPVRLRFESGEWSVFIGDQGQANMEGNT